jgi:hypothetical protein
MQSMRVTRIAWLGTRTDHGRAMADFLEQTLGLELLSSDDDDTVFRVADGSKVEVFGSSSRHNKHFATGPVVGFLVDDVTAATEELRVAGIPIVSGPIYAENDVAWVHFRAPDGNIYEITQGADLRPTT